MTQKSLIKEALEIANLNMQDQAGALLAFAEMHDFFESDKKEEKSFSAKSNGYREESFRLFTFREDGNALVLSITSEKMGPNFKRKTHFHMIDYNTREIFCKENSAQPEEVAIYPFPPQAENEKEHVKEKYGFDLK